MQLTAKTVNTDLSGDGKDVEIVADKDVKAAIVNMMKDLQNDPNDKKVCNFRREMEIIF